MSPCLPWEDSVHLEAQTLVWGGASSILKGQERTNVARVDDPRALDVRRVEALAAPGSDQVSLLSPLNVN